MKIIKTTAYNSRTYHITVVEYSNGTAYADIQTKRLYKHGVCKWRKNRHKIPSSIFEWFGSSICLIDYAKDYIEYYDCLYRLRHSKCARKWFVRKMKPYLDKFF